MPDQLQLNPIGLPMRRVFAAAPAVEGIEVTINGVDLSGEYKPGSLSISDELELSLIHI